MAIVDQLEMPSEQTSAKQLIQHNIVTYICVCVFVQIINNRQ